MKFKFLGNMRSHPELKIDTTIDPINIDTSITGSFEGEIGSISAEIGEIPVRFAIPFMKRRCKHPVVASIGGFKINLSPFKIRVEKASLDLKAVIGPDGIKGKMDCQVACKTEMKGAGNICGKVGVSHLNLGDDDFDEVEWCD